MKKYTSLKVIQADIAANKITLVDLVHNYLNQIEKTKNLNIYIEIYAKEALQRAKELDLKYKQDPSSVGKLFGMVTAVKDVFCFKNHSVTAGSKILEGFESLFTATALQRALDQDIIFIGRVNCDEFAMGSTNENSTYGVTRNALDPNKVPGGSSGGSAVAVQANTCLTSFGSDTGGSVRQPAAFCGIIGLKPSYGRISRHGLLAYASSFDCVGVLGHRVDDLALFLETIAGADDFDSTASKLAPQAYSHELNYPSKAKIAYLNTAVNHPSIDPEIRQQTLNLIDNLKAQGHSLEPVDFEYLDYIVPAYYVLTTAEASANLARYDGIKYGYRSTNAHNLEETYRLSRTEGFGKEVKRRIMLGTFVLSAGYYDAYYSKAQKVRRLIHDKTRQILSQYDFILSPTTTTTAFDIGSNADDPVAVYLSDIFTVQANMVGIPAIAVPLATHSNGLPIGVQLMADKYKEKELLAFSHNFLVQESN